MYTLDDFNYHLPQEQIAQQPTTPRDHCRLLVSDPEQIKDQRFDQLHHLLESGDLLVLNNTRVIPARLLGKKESGGKIEILLLEPIREGMWRAMAKANRKIKIGTVIHFSENFHATMMAREGRLFHVQLKSDKNIDQAIEKHGQMPLPPYIESSGLIEDKKNYQTLFARHQGAVAAPTAGLHFTEESFKKLKKKGINTTEITLHVGLGTFQPVQCDDINHHVMHKEWFSISEESAQLINQTKKEGGRIIAVGTTVVRSLESAVEAGKVQARSDYTQLFILPGFNFQVIDLMITNFHLPRSTLLMLVAAFTGKERLERDYHHAVTENYRFYSYGDAMLLFP
ncbi:tRNA preQ1(34) S-adenosylmethionine ribosyltransferase-isomerase QueA [Magnetococcales bacterium HHB-1]